MSRVQVSSRYRPSFSADSRSVVIPMRRCWLAGVTALIVVAALTGCSALDVNTPSRLRVDDFKNADGARALFNGVRGQFLRAIAPTIYTGGVLADEFYVDASPLDFSGEAALDKRDSETYEATLASWSDNERQYARSQRVVVAADIARAYAERYALSDERSAMIAELLAMRGFMVLGMAEQICPGFPVRKVDVSDLDRILTLYDGAPQTTDSAFNRALVDFDSAIAYAGDSIRVLNVARVGKARTLVGLGRFAEAAAVTAAVPTEFEASIKSDGQLFDQFNSWAGWLSVANRKGGNGLEYVDAADPRLPIVPTRNAHNGDTTASLYVPAKYNMVNPPMVFASGIEARLIEAESQLAASNGAWLATLNALRSTVGLADTTDPGTAAGRVDLVFRERAFWLFGTGHRLGDLRRLISHYARAAETVFPTGVNQVGATYGTATSIPFPAATEKKFNSAITGCFNR